MHRSRFPCALYLAGLVLALPAHAGGHHHGGLHRLPDGGVARLHGTAASGGDGSVRRGGGVAIHPDGGAGHVRGGVVQGPSGAAGRLVRTTHAADGSWQHQRIAVAHGDGGTASRATRVQRSTTGQWSATRQTRAEGARGSYAGSTTAGDGRIQHASTLTGAGGTTYQGQTDYARGAGISHSGGCTDAHGQPVPCPRPEGATP